MPHSRHPALNTLFAILEGCRRTNNLRPILIATSIYETSGIKTIMRTPLLLDRMQKVGAKMYFFNSTMKRLVEPPFWIFRTSASHTHNC